MTNRFITLGMISAISALSIGLAVGQVKGQVSSSSIVLGVTCDPNYNNRAVFTIANPGYLIFSGTYVLSSPYRTGTWSVGPGGTGGFVYGDPSSSLNLYVSQTGETLFIRAGCGPASPTPTRHIRYITDRTPTQIPSSTPTPGPTPEILTF